MKTNIHLLSALLSVSFAFSLPASQALAQAQTDLKSTLLASATLSATSRSFVQKLYEARGFAPIFVINGQLSPAAQELRAAVASIAPLHGLKVSDYWTTAHEAYFTIPFNPALATQVEMELARAYTDLAVHVSIGRINPSSVSSDIKYARQPFNVAALPAGVSGEGIAHMLNRIAPQHDLYKKQLTIMARLLQIKAQGGFASIGPAKSTLRVGVSSPIVAQIKTRLTQMGYRLTNTTPLYDDELAEVIRDVQTTNLTDPTGMIVPGSSATWEYFKNSSDRRIQQVEANLEKLRWMPNQLESRHIFVNLATSHLYVTDPNLGPQFNTLRDMRIINGRPTRKTPSMRDSTENIVLNPTWGVPTTVFREDKVPMIRDILARGGQYALQDWFAQKRFTVMDDSFQNYIDPLTIDWLNLNPRAANFYIVQQPGWDNALGVAKVMLKNPWSIYMHDTNERELFPSNLRELSSGCMRMEYPIDMVEYLLQGTEWDRFKIDGFVAGPGEIKDKETWVKIPLANKIALYTMHLAANLGDDGVMRFTRDLYAQNASILSALQTAGFDRAQP